MELTQSQKAAQLAWLPALKEGDAVLASYDRSPEGQVHGRVFKIDGAWILVTPDVNRDDGPGHLRFCAVTGNCARNYGVLVPPAMKKDMLDALNDPEYRRQLQGPKDVTAAINGEPTSPVVLSTDAGSVLAALSSVNQMPLRCPSQARFVGDIVGCGSPNVSEPDEEGLCDCGDCGIWFRADESAINAQDVVGKCLRVHAWIDVQGSAVAQKTYQTAVGERCALAYFSDWGKDSTSFVLSGEYQSEGRNVLEAHCVLIPKDAVFAEVRRLADQFSKDVDTVVGQTYAARLLA